MSTHGDAGDLELHLKHNEDEVDDALNRAKIGTASGVILDQQFALSYLDLFMKASVLSTFTSIQLLADHPVLMQFDIQGFGELKYFLAPKLPDQS